MFVGKLLSFLFLPDAALQIRLELGLESFPCAMDQRFRRRERAAEHFGDLFVAQFLLPTECQRDALIFRQRADGDVHSVFQLALKQFVLRATDAFIHDLKQRLVARVIAHLIE